MIKLSNSLGNFFFNSPNPRYIPFFCHYYLLNSELLDVAVIISLSHMSVAILNLILSGEEKKILLEHRQLLLTVSRVKNQYNNVLHSLFGMGKAGLQ